MPWILEEECTGCGICVDECPVDVIWIEDGTAKIDMDGCIRCGICHNVCPLDLIRHDSEKIPERVDKNIEQTLELMKYYDTKEEIKGFIMRMKRHFDNEKVVAEKTLDRLDLLEY